MAASIAILPALISLVFGAIPAAMSLKAGRQLQAIVVLLVCGAAPFVVFLALLPSPTNYGLWVGPGLIQFVACWLAAVAAPLLCWLNLLSTDRLKPKAENTGTSKDQAP